MCAHAREGIFLKCKNVYTHFFPLFGGVLPHNHTAPSPLLFSALSPSHSHSTTIAFSIIAPLRCVPLTHYFVPSSPTVLFPRSSHSPSTLTPDKSLCFTCTLRPLSRNSEISTLQNEYTIKKNLHFSSIFSLFRLISSHIHIGAYPFSAPSIIDFHGESQTNISFPTSSVLTLE